MKKLILLVLSLLSFAVRSQTDTSNYSPLDQLSYDELMLYYINERNPPDSYKGPDTGDSIFQILDPLVIPTQTVYADPLLRFNNPFRGEGGDDSDTSGNLVMEKYKPKMSIGVGSFGFYGDLYNKRFQSPLTARPALDLNISQRITPYLQLNFSVLFGNIFLAKATIALLSRPPERKKPTGTSESNCLSTEANKHFSKSSIHSLSSFCSYEPVNGIL